MKRYLGFILLAVALVVIGTVVFQNSKEKAFNADKAASFARIQHNYLERVGWIRSNPDEKSYKDEVGTFLRWYFKEIGAHLAAFRGNDQFDDYLNELEKRGGKDAQAADKKKAFEYVKKTFDNLRGNYQPVWSATDKGMRLDVVSTDVKREGGADAVQFAIILWGPQRELKEDGRMKKMATSANFSVVWKLLGEKDKLIGEMKADGDPNMKIDHPERFIAEFPPQMLLGYYPMDLVPSDVKRVEITFNVTSRSPSGGEVASSYLWKLDAPSEWKLLAGQKWEGAVDDVRPEEEITGQAKK